MQVSLGVVCLSLACVNQSFYYSCKEFLLRHELRLIRDFSEIAACKESQHAIRYDQKALVQGYTHSADVHPFNLP
jgi:hypothetical protein